MKPADTTTNRPPLIATRNQLLTMSAPPIPSDPHTDLAAVMDTPLAMRSAADHRGPLTVTTLLAHRTDSQLAIVMSTIVRRLARMAEIASRGLVQLATTLAAPIRPAATTPLATIRQLAITRPLGIIRLLAIIRPLATIRPLGTIQRRLIQRRRIRRRLIRRRLIRRRPTRRRLIRAVDIPPIIRLRPAVDIPLTIRLRPAVDIPPTIQLRPAVDIRRTIVTTLHRTLAHRTSQLRTVIERRRADFQDCFSHRSFGCLAMEVP